MKVCVGCGAVGWGGGVKEGITQGFLREMCFESREQKRGIEREGECRFSCAFY